MAEYVALVHKDARTSYGVSFPDVPGCVSAGDTMQEALANAAEALAGHPGSDDGRWRADSEGRAASTPSRPIRMLADDLEGAVVQRQSSRPRSFTRGRVGRGNTLRYSALRATGLRCLW